MSYLYIKYSKRRIYFPLIFYNDNMKSKIYLWISYSLVAYYKLARQAGLADASGWCPVDAGSMASALDPAVFVIGDAAIGGDIPKSAFAAGSQAQVAARALLAGLFGEAAPSASYASTCWSLITADDAVKVSGLYRPEDGRIREVEGTVSAAREPPALRRRQLEENADWYRAMVAGMFG